MGDPNGVGPEIILKALRILAERGLSDAMELIVVGARGPLEAEAGRLGVDVSFTDASLPARFPAVALRDVSDGPVEQDPGRVSAQAGHLAYLAIAATVAMARAGRIDAMVTAPISKEAMHAAGHQFVGHTELLAHLTGARDACMMLAHDKLKVSHVTTHVALSEVPRRITRERMERVIGLTIEAIGDLQVAAPRIAVCGLNPHAGEAGLLGREDRETIAPAVRSFRERGFDVSGPYPGDTIFVKAAAGQFDAVVAMYHDQGHIPVKLLGFGIDPATGLWTELSGVNITLGLPIVRTSVDHGTAFDIAGRGVANAQSMLEAIDLAARLAKARVARQLAAS
jgi:4-hydroxythreonine-4-phosphate dehydrogenase